MPKVSQAHLENRRRQILAAANRCFARVGFHNASMHDVIKESGLSAGAIYNYFSSKEDIIVAIAVERHGREAQIGRISESEPDPFAALTDLAQTFFAGLSDPGQEEERRVGVQLWAEALNNPKLLKVTRQGTAEPLRVLTRLIDRIKASGEIPSNIDSDAMARVMVALFQGFVLQKCWEKDLDVEPYLEAVTYLAYRIRAGSSEKAGRSAPKAEKRRSAPGKRPRRGLL